jgi:hypothetical protein
MILITPFETQLVKYVSNLIETTQNSIEYPYKIRHEKHDFNTLLQEVINLKIYEEDLDDKVSYIELKNREYILECYDKFINSKSNIVRFRLPCGVGKSFICFYIIQETLKKNKYSKFIIFVPWTDLAEQMKIQATDLNIKTCIIGNGNNSVKYDTNLIICINGSIHKIPKNFKNVKYIFIDEAHHIENSTKILYSNDISDINDFSDDINIYMKNTTYKKIKKYVSYEKELHLSATYRNNDNLDYIMTMREAIDKKYITDYSFYIEYYDNNYGSDYKCLSDLIIKNQAIMFIPNY